MHSPHRFALSFVFLASVVACSVTTTANPTGPGSGGASSGDIDRCKRGCDKMKFFDCSSAEEQARCYADCDAATPKQIEVFTGCAESSICDPACRTKIQPPDAKPTPPPAASCATACDKLVSCSLIPVGGKTQCNSICAEKGYQYQIDCVNKTACDKIESTCGGSVSEETGEEGGGGGGGGGGTSVASCQSECDSINFFDCTTTSSSFLFVRQIGTADRTLRFRTQSLTP